MDVMKDRDRDFAALFMDIKFRERSMNILIMEISGVFIMALGTRSLLFQEQLILSLMILIVIGSLHRI